MMQGDADLLGMNGGGQGAATASDSVDDLLGTGTGDGEGGGGPSARAPTQPRPLPPMQEPPPPPSARDDDGFPTAGSDNEDEDPSDEESDGVGGGDDDLLGLGRGGEEEEVEFEQIGLSGNSGLFGDAIRKSGRGRSPEPSRIAEITVTRGADGGGGRNSEEENDGGKTGRRGLFGGWGSAKDVGAGESARGGFFQRKSASYSDNSRHDGANDFGDVTEGGLTGDADLAQATNPNDGDVDAEILAIEDEAKANDDELRPGDHIYVWQTYGINPRAYQRHAVVASVTRKANAEDQVDAENDENLTFEIGDLYKHIAERPDWDGYYPDNGPIRVEVVSFYHFTRQSGGPNAKKRHGKRAGCKKELLHNFIGPDGVKRRKIVRKVRYGKQVKRGLLSSKAAVGTALKRDETGLILNRLRYLLDNPEHLPDHNALSANGECAAMWCVTGLWCTLQGASILQIFTVGQAGGALLAGGILSNITVLAPMPGMWGMAGWWWYVPATVAYPFLVPMLVAFGMASLVPLEILRRNRKKWRRITDALNHTFWSTADDDVRDRYFGIMAAAEREAEMRSFFGVRESDISKDESKYMPLGVDTPGGVGEDDEDEDAEAAAMQAMENSCQGMAATMDLSGKPPPKAGEGTGAKKGPWGRVKESFLRGGGSGRDGGTQTSEMEQKGMVS